MKVIHLRLFGKHNSDKQKSKKKKNNTKLKLVGLLQMIHPRIIT